MRVLVLFAHPVETSFQAALHRAAVGALTEAGHEVDDLDLYADGFDPILSRQERIDYLDEEICRNPVETYVNRVLAAEAIVLIYPVWNYGYPAILKGFFDRVFLPGVAFRLRDGKARPNLWKVRKLAAVATYGGTRLRAMVMGDPPRKSLKRGLRILAHPLARTTYLALYDMNRASEEQCAAFLEKVRQRMRAF